ncbi:hypothetical protein FOZ62_001405, partial [Perkinsus olseni]
MSVMAVKAFGYTLNNPAKEMLYLNTTQDVRFQAKSWIDIWCPKLWSALAAMDATRDRTHHEWETLTTDLDKAFDLMWERVELEEAAGKATYAYVCLVYGHRDDILGEAIACCNSIHKTGTNYPVVCMYTNDVPQHHITILNAIFEHTVCVPIIYGASSLYKKDWFKEVFTKLHIFNPH